MRKIREVLRLNAEGLSDRQIAAAIGSAVGAKQLKKLHPAERAAFKAVWPLAKFPVLRDDAHCETIPESSIIIDYLARTEASVPSRHWGGAR